jgi:hypothetical protein
VTVRGIRDSGFDAGVEPRRKPLDAADKRIFRVLSAVALGPQPSADFGPFEAFVVRL